MIIEYSLDDDFFQIFSMAISNFQTDYQEDSFDPIILTDADLFREAFQNKKGIKLKEVTIKDNNKYTGKIIIEFDNFQKSLELLPAETSYFTFKSSGKNITISQDLNIAEMDPDGLLNEFIISQKSDDEVLYNKLMNEARFSFELNTKTPIRDTKGVNLVNNKKAEYSFMLNELMDKNKKLSFLISL